MRKPRSSRWTARKSNQHLPRPTLRNRPNQLISSNPTAPNWFSRYAIFTAHSIDALCLVTYSEIATGLDKKGAFMAGQKNPKKCANGKKIETEKAQRYLRSPAYVST